MSELIRTIGNTVFDLTGINNLSLRDRVRGTLDLYADRLPTSPALGDPLGRGGTVNLTDSGISPQGILYPSSYTGVTISQDGYPPRVDLNPNFLSPENQGALSMHSAAVYPTHYDGCR